MRYVLLNLVMAMLWIGISSTGVLAADQSLPVPRVDELLSQARTAFRDGQTDRALALVNQAVQVDPKNPLVYFARAAIHDNQQKHAAAVADYSKVLQLDPKAGDIYDLRGSEQLKLGQVQAAIDDFDKYLEFKPDQKPFHWKRGIALYYAGRYDDGASQFAAYQNVDDNDVENAVWRFLCMARASGVKQARDALLTVKNDPRVPMMQIYALFAGKGTAEQVLDAAKAGDPPAAALRERLFYAHLYLGLYDEATGNPAGAREHITLAADKYYVSHYMGDIARVHAGILAKQAKP
jgi:lipoprotein NlpI